MAAGEIFYRAEGGVDFKFRFAWRPSENSWRIYILDQPPYGSRSAGAVETHRLGLPRRPYVCWTGAIEDFDDARYIASVWANATMTYIRTGASFSAPPGDRENPADRSTLANRSEEALRAALTEARIPPPSSTPSPISRPPQGGVLRRLLDRIG